MPANEAVTLANVEVKKDPWRAMTAPADQKLAGVIVPYGRDMRRLRSETSRLRSRSDGVGHCGAARPERPVMLDRRVSRRLMLDFGIELRAK